MAGRNDLLAWPAVMISPRCLLWVVLCLVIYPTCIVGLVHPREALCFPAIAYHGAVLSCTLVFVGEHHRTYAASPARQGPSPVPIPNPYENFGKSTGKKARNGDGKSPYRRASSTPAPAGSGPGRPPGTKNKPGAGKTGPNHNTKKRKADQAKAVRITKFFSAPAAAPASPSGGTLPSSAGATPSSADDGGERDGAGPQGRGAGGGAGSGSGEGCCGEQGERRKTSSGGGGGRQGKAGERQRQRTTSSVSPAAPDSDSEEEEDEFFSRLSHAQLAWVADIKAKVNAGIVHERGNVVEKDGGFPYDGGWAVPPLASRQNPAGEHRVHVT